MSRCLSSFVPGRTLDAEMVAEVSLELLDRLHREGVPVDEEQRAPNEPDRPELGDHAGGRDGLAGACRHLEVHATPTCLDASEDLRNGHTLVVSQRPVEFHRLGTEELSELGGGREGRDPLGKRVRLEVLAQVDLAVAGEEERDVVTSVSPQWPSPDSAGAGVCVRGLTRCRRNSIVRVTRRARTAWHGPRPRMRRGKHFSDGNLGGAATPDGAVSRRPAIRPLQHP